MVSVNNISVSFAGKELFEDISFVISAKEKIALAGKNGAGKSTLLKIIAGKENATSGEVALPKNFKIGYLPQVISLEKEGVVREICKEVFADVIEKEHLIAKISEEIAEREDYDSEEYLSLLERFTHEQDMLNMMDGANYEEEIERTLLGLGFERSDLDRHSSTFSGGWRMRIELAKILLAKPDLLLLDEPTNHLDMESIAWLEKFLINSSSALILISHDKYFLDNICKRTLEIDLGSLYDYKTNYSHYLTLRKERLEQQLKAYENQQKAIKDTEAFIDRFRYKPSKSNQVQSRIKQLEKIEKIEIDNMDNSRIHFRFIPANPSGSYPIIAEDLGKSYGDKLVFENANITIERGKKIALLGKNGAGKSTFVKIVMGEIEDYSGSIKLGHNVEIAYFAQNQSKELDPNLSIYETIDREAKGEIRNRINDLLGAFMFGGENSEKKISMLSGGELARVALIKLLLRPANLLILDEPTNHLDIRSKDVLKEAIKNFDGTVIIVSHDREFLDGLVTEVYEFENHKVSQYLGSPKEWLAKKQEREIKDEQISKDKSNNKKEISAPSENALSYQAQKEQAKERRAIEKEIKSAETKIEKLEAKHLEMQTKLSNGEEVDSKFFEEYKKIEDEIAEAMLLWEELSSRLN